MKPTSPKTNAPAYICKSIRQSTKKQATNSYLRQQDKVKVMNTCGDSALILYEFYIVKSGVPDFRFEDINVATSLDWNIYKVKKNRLRLIENGYFYQRRGKLNDGAKTVITYLDPSQIKEIQQESSRQPGNSTNTAVKTLPLRKATSLSTLQSKPKHSLFRTKGSADPDKSK